MPRARSARTPPAGARIQSVARAGAILDALAAAGEIGLAELSRRVGLGKSTTYYLAESLVGLGLAERTPDGHRYRLGLKNLEFGRAVQRRMSIAAIARPSLIALCARTKETVNLAVPYLLDALMVESLEGAYGVRATAYAGTRAAYHSTACGKALLAAFDPATRRAIYAARPLTAATPRTITDVAVLERQIAEIQRAGYAFDLEENELGAHCVAAAIVDGFAQPVGAISVSGPAQRLPRRTLADIARLLVAETRAISATLVGGATASG
ncbi:MAG: IclR family transcriptional regulator [Rhodospirillaceae bacterium]|nr:IclR family transcriptional regulator [Rhodospirillaceae bacterium]